MMSLLLTVLFIGLMFLRVPVSMAIALATLPPLLILDRNLILIPQFMIDGVSGQALLAVPFFILAGNLFNALGLSRRIWEFALAIVGHLKGGLGHVMVVANMIFAGISGSALADIAGLGVMQIEAMKRAGYRAEFAASLTIASSLLAPIIPPSIMFIIYAVMMNVSVGHLFVAGVLPGLAMAAVLLANNYLLARAGWEKVPPPRRSSWGEIWRSFWRGLPALLTPVVILRSMITGLVTPTEASVLAVLYALFLGLLYREINWTSLREAFTSTARTTALIMFLTGIGSVMSFVITSEQVAEQLARGLGGLTDNKYAILSLVTLALLVLGCFMETVPAMLIGIPLFGPLVVKFGIDPIHFGVVLTYALLLGIVHPPVGLGLFAVCAVTKLKLEAVTVATMRFYPAFIVVLLIYMFFPALSTWLPSVVFAK
jgi:tripartite ATP-independent transporter DctM subunit